MEQLSEILTDTTQNLVESIEKLINDYENQTGISVNDMSVGFDEKECRKTVHILCDYYNFEGAIVRRNRQ